MIGKIIKEIDIGEVLIERFNGYGRRFVWYLDD